MNLDRVKCTKHIGPGAVGQVHWSGYSEPCRFRIWEIEGIERINVTEERVSVHSIQQIGPNPLDPVH